MGRCSGAVLVASLDTIFFRTVGRGDRSSFGGKRHQMMKVFMHAPNEGTLLPFPVHLQPYIVAGIRATREELRAALGQSHFVETDSTRTSGGDEDMWAWELPSGQRFLLVLQVPYGKAELHCDPPDAASVVEALGIDAGKQRLEVLPTPIIHPAYTGP